MFEDTEFEKNFRVAKTTVGKYWVSTVKLAGLFGSLGTIFETMIKYDPDGEGSRWLDYQERYATREAAEAGHLEAVRYAEDLVSGKQKES